MSITQSLDRTVKIYPNFEIVFVMDPQHRLDLKTDVSLRLIQAFQDLNHVVYWTEIKDVFVEQGKVYASVSLVVDTHPLKLGPPHIVCLDEIDALVHRISLPMDEHFIHMTHMLKFVSPDVCQFNSPRGLRDADENLLGMNWPDLIPPTLVTMDVVGLKSFLKQHRQVVLKSSGDRPNQGALLLDVDKPDYETKLNSVQETWANKPSYWVAQKYLPEVSEGQKNILVINGESVGAVNIVPATGRLFADWSQGDRVEHIQLNERDQFLIAETTPTLARWGLTFVDLHVIAGMITKIKVMNPTPILQTDREAGGEMEMRIVGGMVKQIQSARSPVFQMKPGCC